MTSTDEPIITSALRTFFKVIFGLLGLCIGIIPVVLFFGAMSSMGGQGLEVSTEVTIHQGVSGKRQALAANSPLLLRVDINGFIGSQQLNGASLERVLQESREGEFSKDRVKGILLVINTPGGVASEADKMYRQIMRYKELYKVPVVAYVDGLCASGGMYIAAAADQVLASDTSIVGSIGVVLGPIFNFADLMERYGVKAKTITAGNSKDTFNPTRPWREDEGRDIQVVSQALYERFVDIVVENRKDVDRDRLVNEFGARVFSAAQGMEYGLVDAAGFNLWEAIEFLAQQAELSKEDYQVISLAPRVWLGQLFNAQSPVFSGTVRHELILPPALDPALNSQMFYYYYNPMGTAPEA